MTKGGSVMYRVSEKRISIDLRLMLPAILAALPGIATAVAQEESESKPAAVVRMTDELDFAPAKVTVTVGDTVLWKNEPSTIVHTVTADPDLAKKPENVQLPEGAETFNSGKMEAGETFSHTFKVPGLYKYVCIPHELAGMLGQVKVKPKPQSKKEKQQAKHRK